MPIAGFRTQRPIILVMGNEGYGLRTNTRRCCQALLRIDGSPAAMASDFSDAAVVDSLNVSVATGILLHHLISCAQPASP